MLTENEKDIVLPETWYDGKKTSRHRIANKMRVIIDLMTTINRGTIFANTLFYKSNIKKSCI